MSEAFLPLHAADPVDANAVLTAMRLREDRPEGRARVVAVMIGSLDGRATVNGRSGGLGSPADRAILRESRAHADAVLVGSRTLRAERYGRMLDDEHRAERVARGLSAEVRLVTIQRDLSGLPIDEARIFSEEGMPVTVFTESSEQAVPTPSVAADLEVVRLPPWGLEPAAVVRTLHETHGVDVLATEGGPTLLRVLLAGGVLDDLVFTLAPLLVGANTGPGLLGDGTLDEAADLAVRAAYRAGEHLFLHYTVTR
jgi:riboflavin biosynthesis pyrimidine reductase